MDLREKDFPILRQKIHGKSLIYLDNAATSQKPKQVIKAITDFYTKYNNNIHRSVHAFGEKTTQLYEDARKKVAAFINADPDEIIFTKGTTESINFIAQTWALDYVHAGDEILISELEHHSNMIPWQKVVYKNNAQLKYIALAPNGLLDLKQLPQLLHSKTKLAAVTHVSNSLGSTIDISLIINAAHLVGAKVLIDAAQSIPHQKIDVKKLKCDFLAFSGHKMLGPTGIGVLYIKKELHDQVRPFQYGGGMVYQADYYTADWQVPPHKFEAGTPPIAQAIGLGAAIDYINEYVNYDRLQILEAELCSYTIDELSLHPRITILGPIPQLKKMGHLVSFTVDGIHAHDVATYLSQQGICVRAGNHCAQPLAKKIQIPASVRASFYLYNSHKEVEKFSKAIRLLLEK